MHVVVGICPRSTAPGGMCTRVVLLSISLSGSTWVVKRRDRSMNVPITCPSKFSLLYSSKLVVHICKCKQHTWKNPNNPHFEFQIWLISSLVKFVLAIYHSYQIWETTWVKLMTIFPSCFFWITWTDINVLHGSTVSWWESRNSTNLRPTWSTKSTKG